VTNDESPTALKMLLDYGANINCHDTMQITPIHKAYISGKQYETTMYLLERGANLEIPNQFGYTLSYDVHTALQTIPSTHKIYPGLQDIAQRIQDKGPGRPLIRWNNVTPCAPREKRSSSPKDNPGKQWENNVTNLREQP